jgi:hypothetical protein
MKFNFHDLDDQEFESLATQICMEILGMGTVVFTKGRDGGKDGRFTGIANNFPSEKSPVSGNFIVQAKHTANPYESCSDSAFKSIIKKEIPRIENLVKEKELDYYLLFTNRRLTGGTDNKILTKIKAVKGVKDAWLIAKNNLEELLKKYKKIWIDLGYNRYNYELRIHPEDIGDVITAFHNAKNGIEINFDSKNDFKHPGIEKKNVINNLSCDYYDEIIANSVKHFHDIQKFLENPRNAELNEQYHDTADEIKTKLMIYRDNFNTFEEVLAHLYDLIIDENPDLKCRRRLANIFLHYMYCNCDIGKNA